MLCLQKGNQISVEDEIKNIVDAPNILVIGHKITSHDGTQINLIRLQHHGEVIQEEASYASNAIKLGILSEIAHSITTAIMTKVNNVAEGGGVALISSTKPTNESCGSSPTYPQGTKGYKIYDIFQYMSRPAKIIGWVLSVFYDI